MLTKGIQQSTHISRMLRWQRSPWVKTRLWNFNILLSNILDSQRLLLWLSPLQQWQPVTKENLYLPTLFTIASTPGILPMLWCSEVRGPVAAANFRSKNDALSTLATPWHRAVSSDSNSCKRKLQEKQKQQWSEWALRPQQAKGANIEIATINQQMQLQQNEWLRTIVSTPRSKQLCSTYLPLSSSILFWSTTQSKKTAGGLLMTAILACGYYGSLKSVAWILQTTTTSCTTSA